MKIKIVQKSTRLRCMPQTFEYAPGYVFTANPNCRDYDWLVVYDELREDFEELACPQSHTILATSEPTSIKDYSRAYTRQFAYLLTNRPLEAEHHSGYRLGRGYYKWFNDRTWTENASIVLPPKTKLVSAVCSSKRMRHTKHDARFRLIEALKSAVPGLEWYGHGIRSFDKKYEVMDAYKYHVTVENHIAPHHWSEKLADAFLCECLPFYAGAPDLAEDFPPESFIPIPIDDPLSAVEIVRSAIANGEYERRREAVLAAKQLILERYNFWAQVIAVIEGAPECGAKADGGGRIFARKVIRRRNLGATLEEGWGHLRRALGI